MKLEQQQQVKKWVAFWLETSYVWGLIASQEDWLKSLADLNKNPFTAPQDIYTLAKKADVCYGYVNSIPSFGTRAEHINGKLTLGEFFDMHGMEKVVSPIKVPSK